MTGVLQTVSQQYFLDDGTPNNGGTIKFNDAITNNLKDVFTTTDLDVPTANPLDLGTDGRPVVPFFLGTGTYDIYIYDSDTVKTEEKLAVPGAGVSSDESVQSVANIVDLKALDAGASTYVDVAGYYAAGDGGGGRMYWDSTSGAVQNNGTIFIPNSVPGTGRWKRIYDKEIDIKWFGAYGDNSHDDTIEIIAAYTWANAQTNDIFFSDGNYLINGALTFGTATSIRMGSGAYFSAASSQTVTINGSFDAGLTKVFGTNITAVFGTNSISVVRPQWWGALGDGSTDDTAAFDSALAVVGGNGGGKILLAPGDYGLIDFDLDYRNVIIEGETSGYGYEAANKSVILRGLATAVYCIQLKRTDGTRNAAYSVLKNLSVFTTQGIEYGVLISEGGTVMEQVNVQGFQYGCTIAQRGNQNKFLRCSFNKNTKVGFAVTEVANQSYLHPNVSFTGVVTSTTMSLRDCNIRENQFGVIIREGESVKFTDCVVESNVQNGLYCYKTTGTNVNTMLFENVWFENNYVDYDGTPGDYFVTGAGNYLKITSSTYAAWVEADDAGFQVNIDSQTRDHASGPSAKWSFNRCKLNAAGVNQKGLRVPSARWGEVKSCNFLGGDQSNFISLEGTADYWHFIDVNGGTGSIGTQGNRTAIIVVDEGFQGGTQWTTGNVSAPGFRFPATLAPVANANTLDAYEEGTWQVYLFSGATTTPDAVPTLNYTRIGNTVHVWGELKFQAGGGSITVNGTPLIIALKGTTQTGTITAGAASADIVGVGTLFESELAVGDQMTWIDDAGGIVTKIVETITDNTNLVLSENASSVTSGLAYDKVDSPLPGMPSDSLDVHAGSIMRCDFTPTSHQYWQFDRHSKSLQLKEVAANSGTLSAVNTEASGTYEIDFSGISFSYRID
jgi:hypothetical protein